MINVISAQASTGAHNIGMTTRPAARALIVAAVLVASWSLQACSPSRTDSAPANTATATATATQRKTTTSEPACGTPTLHVSSPRDGDKVTAPFPIIYETECFSVIDGTIYFTADRIRLDLHPKRSSGTVTVPNQPLLSGRRTVTIQLTDTQGHPLDNPAAITVMTIIIEGSRSAR